MGAGHRLVEFSVSAASTRYDNVTVYYYTISDYNWQQVIIERVRVFCLKFSELRLKEAKGKEKTGLA